MSKITWQAFEPEDPVLGPEKPFTCIEGNESHTWMLSIEEGRMILACDCRLCEDGMEEVPLETFQMDPIPVKISWWHEDQGDDSYSWVDITPQPQPEGTTE